MLKGEIIEKMNYFLGSMIKLNLKHISCKQNPMDIGKEISHFAWWKHSLYLIPHFWFISNSLSFLVDYFFQLPFTLWFLHLKFLLYGLDNWATLKIWSLLHKDWLVSFILKMDKNGIVFIINFDRSWDVWISDEGFFWPSLTNSTCLFDQIISSYWIVLDKLHTIYLLWEIILPHHSLFLLIFERWNNQEHLFIDISVIASKMKPIQCMVPPQRLWYFDWFFIKEPVITQIKMLEQEEIGQKITKGI